MPQEDLDSETTAALDQLFNAWLAFNSLLSKGGVLYKANSMGEILLSSAGEKLIADPEAFKVLMADPKKGFQTFAAQKGVRIQPVMQPFPKE